MRNTFDNKYDKLKSDIFNIHNNESFNKTMIDVFYYQYKNNDVYSKFVKNFNRTKFELLDDIPFLPVEAFKNHKIVCNEASEALIFRSSGTSGLNRSKHFVYDVDFYQESVLKGFKRCYNFSKSSVILALLPSYIENGDSSLVYMVDYLINNSDKKAGGFYLHNHKELYEKLNNLINSEKEVFLFGVSYALLDFIKNYKISFPNLNLIETGGMKGRRKEMIREELHLKLKAGFGVERVYSEYGMTELMSQAYTKGKDRFYLPPWMKVIIRDSNDPRKIMGYGESGILDIIDLANLNSCSFIKTKDIGKLYPDGGFEVLGRFDNSDIRGCNLMI